MVKRNADGGGIEQEGQENFLDMFASAQELEVTENFNLVASDEVQPPAQELTQDREMSGMHININPMG